MKFVFLETGDSYDQNGKLLFTNQISTFIVGAGNFGGKTKASDAVKPAIPVPNRPCDSSIKYTTSVDQAALYRFVNFRKLTRLNISLTGVNSMNLDYLET